MIGENLKNILDIYDTIKFGSGNKTCVCVHGAAGTGKSSLLDKVSNALLLSGANVFFAVNIKPSENQPVLKQANAKQGDSIIRELLRQLVRIYGSKQDPDFIKFISAYVKGTLASDYQQLSDMQYTKESFIKFIYDCVKSEPVILIVDDLDKADAYTVNIIGNLLTINALSFIVFSHSDKLENKTLEDILYRNTEHIEYIQLEDTADLSINKSIPDFNKKQDSAETNADNVAPLLNEIVLVLSKPGREMQLIRHYINNAQQLMNQLAFENAALSLNNALDVYAKLRENSVDDLTEEIINMEIELLLSLARAQESDKQTAESIKSYKKAFSITDTMKTPAYRAEISLRLAECYNHIKLYEDAREHIMISESFFSLPERRVRHYELYTQYIPKYLYVLTELSERTIFREKLKQAYSVCRMDDKIFDAALRCEEGLMHIEYDDFEKAHELLSEAQIMATQLNSCKLWDETTNSLAICCEQMGNREKSEALWNELIVKSHDCIKAAGAMVNIAVMNFDNGGDAAGAACLVRDGIDLCILAGEEQIAADIRNNLKDTELFRYI